MNNQIISNLTKQEKEDLLKIKKRLKNINDISGYGELVIKINSNNISHFKTSISEVNKKNGEKIQTQKNNYKKGYGNKNQVPH